MSDWHIIICCLDFSQLSFYEVVQDNCSSHKCSHLPRCFSNAHTIYYYTFEASATSQLFSFFVRLLSAHYSLCTVVSGRKVLLSNLEVIWSSIVKQMSLFFFFLGDTFLRWKSSKKNIEVWCLNILKISSETFKLNVIFLKCIHNSFLLSLMHRTSLENSVEDATNILWTLQ